MSVVLRPQVTASALEVVGFRAVPATADVAVLDLEGRFTGPRPRRFDRLRLHVTGADGRAVELAAVHATPEGGDGAVPFRVAWAVPVSAVQGAAFALAVGRDLLLELPAPHLEAPDGEPGATHVRLAREINELRRRADEATTAWTGASQALEAEVARLQAEHTAQLEALRAEHAAAFEAARSDHASQLDALRTEHADALQEAHADRDAQVAARDGQVADRDARIEELRADADARVDALRADQESQRDALAQAHEADLARAREEAATAAAVPEGDDDPTRVLPDTPPRTARMHVLPPEGPGADHSRQDFSDLTDISGARAIALGLLAIFFLLLVVILGIGPL